MDIKQDLTDAMKEGRDEVVRVLAEHQVLPVVVERQKSNLMGGSQSPDFAFEREAVEGSQQLTDRQTRSMVVDSLGLTSEAECEALREEIRNHESWGG